MRIVGASGNAINCNLKWIDVSNLEDLSELFMYSKFNGDLSTWDVSGVKNMKEMFFGSCMKEDYKPKR